MPENNLEDFINNFVDAAETCRDKRLINPTLVLIYSAIDILGSLLQSEARKDFELRKSQSGSKETFGIRHSFCFWVDRYMQPEKYLDSECRSIDIYGARCGLLHELRLESNINHSHGAKIITYAWGVATVDDLRRSMAIINKDYIAIHVDTLIDVFKNGITRFLNDTEMMAVASVKSKKFVAGLSTEIMRQFLETQNDNQ